MKQFLLTIIGLLFFLQGYSQITDVGLVGFYPFSGNANDVTTFENHGTLEGPILTEDRLGNPNAAYRFDGVDDRITIPDAPELFLNENFTISAWVLPEEIKTQFIMVKGTNVNGPNAAPYSLSTSGTEDYIFSTRPDGQLVQARDGSYTTGEWILMTGVKEGSSMKLYINGVFLAEEIAEGELVDNTSSLIIGTRLQLPSSTFKGAIDDIRIYNRALSAVEVGSIFTEGDPIFKVTGNVSYDIENNNCTSGSLGLNNAIVRGVNLEGDIFSTTAQSDGSYEIIVLSEGELSINVVQESLPDVLEIEEDVTLLLDTSNSDQVVDFCINAAGSVNDVSVSIIPLQLPRPGVIAQYIVQYENLGTQVVSGNITYEYDQELMFYTSSQSTPTIIEDGLLVFDYDDLLPFETRTFALDFELFIPPVVEGGEELNSTITITPLASDVDVSNNILELKEIVVNSFDPNDKQVLQGEEILEDQVGNYLDYVLRFQNTGTADALRVVVTDTLSENLNWNTLRVLSASHDFKVQITNENEVAFIFEDINLPPQEIDEEGSNGYIAFQIRSVDNLALGELVENTANIFFDFNPPIITNTVITTVTEPLSLATFKKRSYSIYPNPVINSVTVLFDKQQENVQISLVSLQGSEVARTTRNFMDVSSLSSGVYFLKIETNEETFIEKIIKK